MRAYKAGARIFPSLVPFAGQPLLFPDQQPAWEVFERWTNRSFAPFSDGDPITRWRQLALLWTASPRPNRRPIASHTLYGGLFIQEDDPQGFVAAFLDICNQRDKAASEGHQPAFTPRGAEQAMAFFAGEDDGPDVQLVNPAQV